MNIFYQFIIIIIFFIIISIGNIGIVCIVIFLNLFYRKLIGNNDEIFRHIPLLINRNYIHYWERYNNNKIDNRCYR